MRPLHSNRSDTLRFVAPLMACLALTFTANASSLIDKTFAQTFARRISVAAQTNQGCSHTQRGRHSTWMVRGGYQHGGRSRRTSGSSSNRGRDTFSNNNDGADHVDIARGGTTATDSTHLDLEKIAADLRAKKEHIATHISDRKEAIAADLKAKQEKIADEVLRERSPEAFGELGGHASSYDSATAGMDVANRRSFFLGIRRVVLLAQVVELLAACFWQVAFPHGGLAGFFAAAGDSPAGGAASIAKSRLGDGRGRLGLAVAASLAQFSLYTMMLVWFGCDRVVLRAVRVTGWEHGAAAAWALQRLVAGSEGKLSHLVACVWLAGMAFLCAYFGRQL